MVGFRSFSVGATLIVGLALATFSAVAQQKTIKEQLVGTWTLVSAVDIAADGKRSDTWGPTVKGSAIYDANGRYSFMIVRGDLPKVASNNRMTATGDEGKALMTGMIAYFGTYTVNEADKTVSHKVEGSSFANIVGTEAKRIITSISADEMKYTNPSSTQGTRVEGVWKRAK
jgi:hypothetical protein